MEGGAGGGGGRRQKGGWSGRKRGGENDSGMGKVQTKSKVGVWVEVRGGVTGGEGRSGSVGRGETREVGLFKGQEKRGRWVGSERVKGEEQKMKGERGNKLGGGEEGRVAGGRDRSGGRRGAG